VAALVGALIVLLPAGFHREIRVKADQCGFGSDPHDVRSFLRTVAQPPTYLLSPDHERVGQKADVRQEVERRSR
jgi:hypothetical protein